jgi:hypothetical protein
VYQPVYFVANSIDAMIAEVLAWLDVKVAEARAKLAR